MIRVSEIKLPLLLATDMGHSNAEIKAAILKKLSIVEADLAGFNIFKRGVDARKRNAILLAYIVDCDVKNEAKVLAKFAKDPHVKASPDTSYHFVAVAITRKLQLESSENLAAMTKLGDHEQAPQVVHEVQRGASEAGYKVLSKKLNLQPRPVIVGFGPAGIFAALILAQAGFKPIVLERGKPVRERTKDTWALWRW